MGHIQDIHKDTMSILNDEVSRSIKLKVPLQNSPLSYTIYTTTGLISAISNLEINATTQLTIETLVCKILIKNLSSISGCPISDLKKKNVVIVYNNVEYSISKEDPNSFANIIILYINKKS